MGEAQFVFVGNKTYQCQGQFAINITIGEVVVSFEGEVGDFRNSVPQSSSFSKSYSDSSLHWPTSVDARIFADVTIQTMFLLPPEGWGTIRMGYSKQFRPTLFYVNVPEVIVKMTAAGKETVMVPHGTYENAFVLDGTEPEIGLGMTLWVTGEGIVPQAEVTMAMRGVGSLTLTMKLEHYE